MNTFEAPKRIAWGLLLLRILVGWVFLSEGIQKFLYPIALGAGRFAKIGIPVPQFTGPFVGIVEIVCGILILVGLFTTLASVPLLINISVAIVTTKFPMLQKQGFWVAMHEGRTDFCMFVGLIAVILLGPEASRWMKGGDVPGNSSPATAQSTLSRGSSLEVLLVFLRLGCTSFGGPIVHLGYFRKEIVERRKWCSESTMAEIIALAQSLPGPASSQVGFALGILRSGWLGGLAAWVGFTLPSALLMLAFAFGHSLFSGSAGQGLLHGLQLVAVAVVAQAVMAMQRSLAPDKTRLALAIVATGLTLFLSTQMTTLITIAGGAAAGICLFRSVEYGASEPVGLSLPKPSVPR